jgi:ribose-phosphate pyrophosphokinase
LRRGLIGEVNSRSPVVVDDMISTGGTILSAVDALLEGGARQPIIVAATHGLLVDRAEQKLSERSIAKIIITDSIRRSDGGHLEIERVSLDRMIARTIRQMHENF